MKAPKEYKQWVNNLRSRYGKKNGVILFDSPYFERLLGTDKKVQKPKDDF